MFEFACFLFLFLLLAFAAIAKSVKSPGARKSAVRANAASGKLAAPTLDASSVLPYPLPLVLKEGRRVGDVLVQGHSDPLLRLTLGLANLTCTCPSFATRAGESKDSLTRLCRHLFRELREHGEVLPADGWQEVLFEEGWGPPLRAWSVCLRTAPDVLVIWNGEGDWVNIYARTVRKGERIGNASGKYRQFGWSTAEWRWAYGKSPPGGGELREILGVMFPSPLKAAPADQCAD